MLPRSTPQDGPRHLGVCPKSMTTGTTKSVVTRTETPKVRYFNPPKNFCKNNAVDVNNSNVWNIDDYYSVRDIVHESLPQNAFRKIWTRNMAMNSTHYYDDFGIYKFPGYS